MCRELLLQLDERPDGLAVDGQHAVAGLQARLVRRRARHDLADDARELLRRDEVQHEEDDGGEDEVRRRTCAKAMAARTPGEASRNPRPWSSGADSSCGLSPANFT